MYKFVKEILDKSKETGEDILVARDMCIAENKESEDDYRKAGELIGAHYDAIAKCRRENDEESIKKLCDAVARGNASEIRAVEKEILEK